MTKAIRIFIITLLGMVWGMTFALAPIAAANVSDIAEVADELHPPRNEVERELHPDAYKESVRNNDPTWNSNSPNSYRR